MMPRRLLAVAACLALAAFVACAGPASARPAVPAADRCLASGPIPLTALRAAARSGCSLVGRTVTAGRVAVVVPPVGMSVAGDGVGRHGDVAGLRLTNTGTRVLASRSGGGGGGGWYLGPLTTSTPGTPVDPVDLSGTMPPSAQRAGATGACSDRTFNLEHHRWATRLRYHTNLDKKPQRLHRRTVVRQVKAANANMRLGRNTCGKPRLKTPASRYLGITAKAPNIKVGGPTCGRLNATNVVGFGNLPAGFLGWTCYWYDGTGRMIAADMVLDNGPDLVTHLPAGCMNKWDFEGTVTHEWGHVYGLAHTGPGHPNLTMQHLLKPCSTYARTLGLGDWLGMNTMYGHRR
jgi:hypothetical protein